MKIRLNILKIEQKEEKNMKKKLREYNKAMLRAQTNRDKDI